jgi:hypothetical protein
VRGQARRGKTASEHAQVAGLLALRYTRNIASLNAFAAIVEDKRRLDQRRMLLEARAEREGKQGEIERQFRASRMSQKDPGEPSPGRISGKSRAGRGTTMTSIMANVLAEVNDCETSSDSSSEASGSSSESMDRFASPAMSLGSIMGGGARKSGGVTFGGASARRESSFGTPGGAPAGASPTPAGTSNRRQSKLGSLGGFGGGAMSPQRTGSLRKKLSMVAGMPGSGMPGSGMSPKRGSGRSPKLSFHKTLQDSEAVKMAPSPDPSSSSEAPGRPTGGRRVSTMLSPQMNHGRRESKMITRLGNGASPVPAEDRRRTTIVNGGKITIQSMEKRDSTKQKKTRGDVLKKIELREKLRKEKQQRAKEKVEARRLLILKREKNERRKARLAEEQRKETEVSARPHLIYLAPPTLTRACGGR